MPTGGGAENPLGTEPNFAAALITTQRNVDNNKSWREGNFQFM